MRTGPRGWSKSGCRALLLPLALMLGAVAQADEPAATPAPASAPAPDSGGDLQEVIVTGLRADLEKSLETKKNAAVVLDSIDSTELGRFPDNDVADSLAHLPGITLSRTTGGEGMQVSVRGLGPQYNIVTLNNRILATDDDGRDLAFDVLPSEIITGADVLKSSQASAVEGSIGGTVDLHTASAFDNPGLHAGVRSEGNWNAMSDLFGSRYSAYIEDTNEDRTLGIVLGGVYSDANNRTDSLNAYSQNIYGPATFPFNGGPHAIPLAATPCCITFGSIYDEKKRDAVSGSVEWRPTTDLKIVADGLWTHLNDPQIGYNESYYFPFGTDQNGASEWSNAVVHNGVVTSVSADAFQPEMVNNTQDRVVDTYLAGLHGTWKPIAGLTLDFDGYQSVADRPEGGEDTFVTAGLVTNTPYAEDILNITDVPNSLPILNVAIPPSQLGLKSCPKGTGSSTNPGYCSYTALMNSGFLNNNKYWSTHYVGLNGYSVHDLVRGFSFDAAYDVDMGVFSRVLFGIDDTHREKQRTDISNDWTNGSGQYGTLYNTAGCPIQCSPYSFGALGFDVVSMINPPNFMQGAGGSYPTTLPQLNTAALIAFLKSLNGKANPFYCQNYPTVCTAPFVPFAYALTEPQANPYNSYAVTENSFPFYVEAEFGGDNWSGNIGVRVVRTLTTAATAAAVPVSLWTPTTVGSTQTWNVQYGDQQPIGAKGQYTLPLPSANVSYWAIPQELQLRGALAETMSRPDLNELAPTSSNNAINGQPQLYYGGMAGLQPIKSYQADFSAEWYYQPHAVLAFAAFGKLLRGDIYQATTANVNLGTLQYVGGQPGTVPGTPFLWTVQAPANGAKDTFTGIELTWQHMMDNGFGVHAQFTYTKSQAYDELGHSVGPINAVPPTTESVSLIYDKDGLSGDVTWDHQSSYTYACAQCTEVPGWPAIAEPFTWVTASLHYTFPFGLETYIEGKNLTNAVARTYLNGNPYLPWAPGQNVGQSSSGVGVGYSAYGRTYTAGMAYRF